MRSIDRRFYESPEWRRCKALYLAKANHLCEVCQAKGIYTPADIVHHKIPLSADNFGDLKLMFGFDNLQAVCIACHNDIHGKLKRVRRWSFENGELITHDEPKKI